MYYPAVSSRSALRVIAILSVFTLCIPSEIARAAGSDPAPSDRWGPPSKGCQKGYVWSKRQNKCVPKRSNLINDNERYNYAVWLGKSGEHALSLEILAAMSDQTSPRVLTYLGFNHRSLGEWHRGIALYRQALAKDPDYILAREYLGEGYVKAGKIELAERQLVEIKNRCGAHCKSYTNLLMVIADAAKEHRTH